MRQLLISFVDNEAAIFRTDAGREKTPVTASLLAYAMADALVRVSDQMKMSTDQFPTVQDLALSRFELAHIEEDNRSARRWKRIVSRLFPWFFSAETVAVSLIHPQR
jgi:hypothetical protein